VKLSACAREELGDLVSKAQIVGKYPIHQSYVSKLQIDLNYLNFLEGSSLADSYPTQQVRDILTDRSINEALVASEAYFPGDRSIRSSWRKVREAVKVSGVAPKYDPEIWKNTYSFLVYEFGDVLAQGKILTLDQAMEQIDLSKSPGPMYVGNFKDKKTMLESPLGRWIIDQYWTESKRDFGSFCLYGARLKDEIRPVSKVKSLSTRVIWVAPATQFCAAARLFKDQNDALVQNRNTTVSALGISRYKGEWDMMMRPYLRIKNIFAGDASKFDITINSSMLMDQGRLRFEALIAAYGGDFSPVGLTKTEVYNLVKNVYRDVDCKILQMPDGTVMKIRGCMPSGFLNTASDDTMVHFRLWSYAWMKIVNPSASRENYLDMKKSWLMKLQGDDSLIGFAAKVPNYDQLLKVLNEVFEVSSNDKEFIGIFSAPFLAQRTIQSDGMLVPVPDRIKTMSSMLTNQKGGLSNTLARALGVRQHCWYDKELQRHIQDFINQLVKRYPLLRNEPAIGAYLMPSEIEALYKND
jgi:hypothetical protein